MSLAQITDDDVGTAIVDESGDRIGIVAAVKHGTPYVDPDPGLTDKLKAKLGWEDVDDEDGYPLQDEQVLSVSDDEIRIETPR
jgi:hypothetical protein